jgi:hypothetical protein
MVADAARLLILQCEKDKQPALAKVPLLKEAIPHPQLERV